jgi:hypothetical protein
MAHRIYVDLDGVVTNFWEAAQKAFGAPLTPRYSLEETFPHIDDDHIAYWIDSPKTYLDLTPVPGAIDGIQALRHFGWRVKFVTSRPLNTSLVTESWLKRRGLITSTTQVVHVNKDEFIPNQGASFSAAVEDHLEHARLLAEFCDCTYLFNWPYNYGPAGKAMRIGDSEARTWWPELLEELLGGGVWEK